MNKVPGKSKGARSVSSLPVKKLSVQKAKGVKGGAATATVHGGWDPLTNKKF